MTSWGDWTAKQIYVPEYEQPQEPPKEAPQGTELPKPVQLDSVWKDPPPVAPELIEGVLRQGHKMIISAP